MIKALGRWPKGWLIQVSQDSTEASIGARQSGWFWPRHRLPSRLEIAGEIEGVAQRFNPYRRSLGSATSVKEPWSPLNRLPGSGCQAFAALGATGVDHGATTAGLHANQETMGAGAADFGGLVSAFHIRIPESP